MKKKILSLACVLISAISFAQIPTDGLVAHYPFNGNANDASTNSNDGTVNGATLTTDRFGNANSAYSFDGVDDDINCGNSNIFDLSNFTISLWFRELVQPPVQGAVVISKSASDDGEMGYRMTIDNDNLNRIIWSRMGDPTTGAGFHTSTVSFEDSIWTHYVGIKNNDTLFIYINGINAGYTTGMTATYNNTNPLLIGKSHVGGGEWHFGGEVDDIRIYDVALNDAAISELFTEGQCYETITKVETVYDTVINIETVQDTNHITVYDTVTTNVTVYDTVTTQINSSIPISGLVAHYPFNGNANDESTNSNDGTVNGATLTEDRFGNANSAYSFDGVDDYIRIPHDSSLDFSQGGVMSVSFWVYMDSLPEDSKEYQLLMKVTGGGNTTEGYQASIFSNGTYVLRGKNGSGSNWVGNTNTSDLGVNDEYHVVSIIDGQKSKNYINGIFISETTTTNSSIGSNTEDLIFGWNNWLSNATSVAFKGKLDDIRIYNKAITQEEVSSLYNEGACYKTVHDTVTTTNNVTVQDTLNIYLSEIVTSINDASQAVATVKVYPNPTDENLTVSIDNYTNLSGVTIKVLDALGTVVHQQLITGSTQSIDVNSWTAGVYFLHVINGSKTVDIKKIVVNN